MGNISEPSYRKRVGYQAALLGGFATLAAALLVIGNITTREAIAQRQAEDIQSSLKQVIPDDIHDNNLLEDTVIIDEKWQSILFYRATLGGKLTAAAFSVYGKGYSGDINLMMGVDTSGNILSVRILSHTETPGLGDKIEEKKSDWIYSFDGHSLSNTPDADWAVKKDGGKFDQFSGATITPRAVIKAVKKGLEIFNKHLPELLNKQPETKSGVKADKKAETGKPATDAETTQVKSESALSTTLSTKSTSSTNSSPVNTGTQTND